MSYKERKIKELISIIRAHRGLGESEYFYSLRQEICSKLGEKAWEKMLSKAKVEIAQEEQEKSKNK